MLKFINNIKVTDGIYIILQIIFLIVVYSFVIMSFGYDTLHVRVLINLLAIGGGSVAAFIAYKNYKTSTSEKRKDYLLKYHIEKNTKAEDESKKYTLSSFPVVFDKDASEINRRIDFILNQKKEGQEVKQSNIEALNIDIGLLNKNLKYFLKMVAVILYHQNHMIERIRVGEKDRLLEIDQRDLIDITLREYLGGYVFILKSKSEALETKIQFLNEGCSFRTDQFSDQYASKELKEIYKEYLPDEEKFYEAIGKFKYLLDENNYYKYIIED